MFLDRCENLNYFRSCFPEMVLNWMKEAFMWKFNSTLKLLILMMIAGLIFRVARIFEDHYIDKDAVVYISMADKMADGHLKESFSIMPRIPPLYIALMALGKKIGIGTETAGNIISLLAGILLIIPVFVVAREIAGEKVALAAAFLATTHPYLIRDSAEVMRDSLFLTLLFTSIAFAVKAAGKEAYSRLWYLSGFFAALSILTRSEGNELLLAFPVWVLYEILSSWEKGDLKLVLKRFLFSATAAFAGFIIVAVPSQFFLFRNGSDWTMLDRRIFSYAESFMSLSKEQIIETEGQ